MHMCLNGGSKKKPKIFVTIEKNNTFVVQSNLDTLK